MFNLKYNYKKIEVNGNYYIYEAHRSGIFQVNEYVYNVFDYPASESPDNFFKYNENSQFKTREAAIGFYDKLKVNIDNNLVDLKSIDRDKVFSETKAGIENSYKKVKPVKLVISITGNCNLDCKYCFYGDDYKYSRNRSSKKNSLNDLINIIDLFAEISNPDKRAIAFYGGEPLLELNNIKRIISYCQQKEYGFKFMITTNGTLLNPETADYLIYNDFDISVSIDINKDIHDMNRIFPDGKGSYNNIMENLDYIKKRYPETFGRINFISTVDETDKKIYKKALKFAKEEKRVTISPVNISDDQFTEKMKEKNHDREMSDLYRESIEKFIDNFGNYIESEENIKNIDYFDNILLTSMNKINKRNRNENIMSLSGSCIPVGLNGLFVAETGEIYPCEKIDYALSLGNIKEMSKEKFIKGRSVLEKFLKFKLENCFNCWAKNLCTLCFADCVESNEFKLPKGKCSREKENGYLNLKIYIRLCEKYGEDKISNFYKKF